MDQKKIGSFLAELRHEKNITQEQLGQVLHVTNKTISRWETGAYMPDLDLLMKLSEFYHISINEILSAQRLTLEEFRQHADNNLVQYTKDSIFSLRERMNYFEKKWIHEHKTRIIITVLFPAGFLLTGILHTSLWMMAAGTLMTIAGFFHVRLRIMDYVDKMIFEK